MIDPAVIEELYLASQAGVQIDLIVRGMCSLRPGLPEVSERIRVLSVVDRYLEHARIFYFHNSGEPLYFLASADWMPRNFDRRIEIGFPIIEAALQNRLKEVLEIQLADNVKGWWMQSDGRYIKIKIADQPLIRSQERLYESFAASANEPLSQVPSQPKS